MKTAVVFYTKDGSTRVTAQVLAEKLGADIFELAEAKKRGGSVFAFMAAGFGAVLGRQSRLKDDYAAQMGAYERICIGTPVWASRTAPAVNAFVRSLDAQGKRIIIFTVQADPNPSRKGADALAAALKKKGAVVEKTLCLHGADIGRTAQKSDMGKQISALL